MPPITNTMMKPTANSSGGSHRMRLARDIVMIQAKTWMPLGMAINRLAAEKNDATRNGRPVANMWCTHSPKLMNAVATRAAATRWYAAIVRRENAWNTIDAMPVAGMK